MDLFSGLEDLGIEGFESVNLYETHENGNEKEEQKIKKTSEEIEAELIYDRAYTCPVCDKEFKSKTVKSNKAKLLSTDLDLRPVYQNIDSIKYDVIACTECGYSALTRYFGPLSSTQIKMLKTNIAEHFRKRENKEIVYSYDTAIDRSKLALACAVVRHAKASEKAYICLKTAWLIRGKEEHMDELADDYNLEMDKLKKTEESFLKNAMEGFVQARQTETFPIAGMDETTLDYLIAALAIEFRKYDIAAKMIGQILVSPKANNRMKDKTRELKEVVKKELKKQKQENQY